MSDFGREVDAGDSSTRKHAGETLLGSGRIKRGTIKQKPITRSRQKQSRLIVGANRGAQFAPGSFILFGGARMPEIVHSGELQQNVQATYKGAGGCSSSVVGVDRHSRGAEIAS
ncbi:MAG: hypothetical protein WA369_14495 [Candidatus Acidiferrales bacterium]